MSKLSDHLLTSATQAISAQVSSMTLDKITRAFDTAAFNRYDEVILDCYALHENEQQQELSEILGVPADTEYPTEGYLIFWN